MRLKSMESRNELNNLQMGKKKSHISTIRMQILARIEDKY